MTYLASAPAPPPPTAITFPLPSTTNFGASYIPLTIADLAITANSPKLSSYHALNLSSFPFPALVPFASVVGVELELDEDTSEPEEEEDEEEND